MDYRQSLSDRAYQGNVVLKILGHFFCIRLPDDGLSIPAGNCGIVQSVVVSPTQVDLRRVSSTISNFSFKLLDRDKVISTLIGGDALSLLDSEVEIFIGRSGVGMSFSEYFKLPTTRVKKIDYDRGEYNFQTSEQTERLNRALFQVSGRLSASATAETTELTLESVAGFPDSGFIKFENEIASYSGRALSTSRLLNVIRGEFGTTPEAVGDGKEVYLLDAVTGHPLEILLKVLSSGGGGIYDTLSDGCGLPESLIDVAGILALKESDFPGLSFRFFFYQIESGLGFLEDEILTPLGLRFSVSSDSKLTLKVIDRMAVREPGSDITHSTLKGSPKWSVDGNRIVNSVQIEWDFSESLGRFLKSETFTDLDSVDRFGQKDKLTFKFKGVRSDLSGGELASKFAEKTLRRLSTPSPEISISTHIDKSLLGPLDRVELTSDQLPSYSGELLFANELEVVSRSINYLTGDVGFRLAFMSSTGSRFGYIAPSDVGLYRLSGDSIDLGAGRGAYYCIGWKVRVWSELGYHGTFEIVGIAGDRLFFFGLQLPFQFPRYSTNRPVLLRFPDYDEAAPDQRRFAFIGGAANFPDGKSRYTVTF